VLTTLPNGHGSVGVTNFPRILHRFSVSDSDLEHVFQRKLDLPIVGSGSGDHTERAVAQSSPWNVECGLLKELKNSVWNST